jgi:hypothetical protein
MRGSDRWDAAAAELNLHVAERPSFFGTRGRLVGKGDGLRIEVTKRHRGEGIGTAVQIDFSTPIGPPGLRVKFRRLFRGSGDGRKRFGWYVFRGSHEKRAVLVKADDPDQLALWMTADRVEALVSLPARIDSVLVTEECVVSFLGGRGGGMASSEAIIDEVRRVLPLALRLGMQ